MLARQLSGAIYIESRLLWGAVGGVWVGYVAESHQHMDEYLKPWDLSKCIQERVNERMFREPTPFSLL